MNTQERKSTSAQTPSWQEVAESGSPSGDNAVAAAIAAGTSIKEAARAAGVSERTAYRRQRDPEFRRRVDEIRSSFLSDAVGRLAEASTEAVSTLKALLNLWRTRCTMQSCTCAFGKTVSMASGEPLRPSTQAMKMSQTPRFFSSVTTWSQNFAPSVCATHSPSTSLTPASVTPMER